MLSSVSSRLNPDWIDSTYIYIYILFPAAPAALSLWGWLLSRSVHFTTQYECLTWITSQFWFVSLCVCRMPSDEDTQSSARFNKESQCNEALQVSCWIEWVHYRRRGSALYTSHNGEIKACSVQESRESGQLWNHTTSPHQDPFYTWALDEVKCSTIGFFLHLELNHRS